MKTNLLVAMACYALVLATGRAVMAQAGATSVSGMVTGADGKPAADCTINLYSVAPQQPGGGDSKQPKPVATVKTNDKGQYTLENVPPGTYRLIAGVPFKEFALANVTVKQGQKVTLNLKLRARRVF